MKPRTGKTLAVVDTTVLLGKKCVLIICPSPIMATWEDTLLEEEYTTEDVVVIHRKNKSIKQIRNRLLATRPRFFIINYEKVKAADALHIRENLMGPFDICDWDCIIVDESYRIAHWESKTTEYLTRYPKPIYQARFCLSGTPAPETPLNFATQFLFMEGVYFGETSIVGYLGKYWRTQPGTYDKYFVKDPQHLEDIKAYVALRSYRISLKDLGFGCEVFESKRVVAANKAQQLWLNWVRNADRYVDKNGKDRPFLPITRSLYERMISTGVAPITGEVISDNKVLDIIELYLYQPEPMLVVSYFKKVLYRAYDLMTAQGIRCGLIVDVDREEAERIRKSFQDGDLDIVIGQTDKVKEGLDFSRIKKLIKISDTVSQNANEQVGDRGQNLKRTGSYDTITICTEGTTDKRLSSLLKSKHKRSFIKRNTTCLGLRRKCGRED